MTKRNPRKVERQAQVRQMQVQATRRVAIARSVVGGLRQRCRPIGRARVGLVVVNGRSLKASWLMNF